MYTHICPIHLKNAKPIQIDMSIAGRRKRLIGARIGGLFVFNKSGLKSYTHDATTRVNNRKQWPTFSAAPSFPLSHHYIPNEAGHEQI